MVVAGWRGCMEGGDRWQEAQWKAITVVWGRGQRQVPDQGRAGGQREGDVFRKLRALVSGSSRFYS